MPSLLAYPLALLALLLSMLPASAADPLVSVDWLKANLGKPGMVLLDVTSGGGRKKSDFIEAHIPGSVFTDYAKGGWREKNTSGVNGMLPAPEKLAKVIGAHGIDNASHVVVIPMGARAQDVGAATRVYWTFKVLGHDNVSILDGGFVAWTKDVDKETKKPVNPLESGEGAVEAKSFEVKLRPQMIVGKEQVLAAMADKQPLVDNRPNDFFIGINKSPDAKISGTIPGSTNLPESWLTDNNGGKFRTPQQLAKLYQTAGVATSGKQINFCNTGHWASLGWFVSSEIMGNKDAQMYDGSMAEWTQDASAPLERTVSLD